LNSKIGFVKAFAPASIANVAVGFDILGFSFDQVGDVVTLEKMESPIVEISEVRGKTLELPKDPLRNTATAGLVRLLKDKKLDFGFKVTIEKGISLGSGMGGSAASAIAAILAAQAFLPRSLTESEMLGYALLGEAQASGSFHADNLAASLRGGLTWSWVNSNEPENLPSAQLRSVTLPQGLFCVLLHPEFPLETKAARGILTRQVSFPLAVTQSAHLSAFILACEQGDYDLLKFSLKDLWVEPQRASLIPGFKDVQRAAVKAGALGCSIAGAGPSLFAWVHGEAKAQQVHEEMAKALRVDVPSFESWCFSLPSGGARIL
jgi:homoserine kinase